MFDAVRDAEMVMWNGVCVPFTVANRTNFNLTDGLALPTFLAGPAAANFTQQVVIRSVK